MKSKSRVHIVRGSTQVGIFQLVAVELAADNVDKNIYKAALLLGILLNKNSVNSSIAIELNTVISMKPKKPKVRVQSTIRLGPRTGGCRQKYRHETSKIPSGRVGAS